MQRLPGIIIAPSIVGGRGVFTLKPIPKGALIEICPVIVLPETDLPAIHGSRLHDYYFLWGDDEKQCAIALGYGSLYNHDYHPNARYEVDFEEETILIYAQRYIKAGEEIFINYNGDPADTTRVWFDLP